MPRNYFVFHMRLMTRLKEGGHVTHRGAPCRPPTTGRESNQGFQLLCYEMHSCIYDETISMSPAKCALPVPMPCASEMLRHTHSWTPNIPDVYLGLIIPQWLYFIFLKLHICLGHFNILPFFCFSLRDILVPWSRYFFSHFQLSPDFYSQTFFLISPCIWSCLSVCFSEDPD